MSKNAQGFLEISPETFQTKREKPLNEKLPESFESRNFVSYRTGLSGEIDSMKE